MAWLAEVTGELAINDVAPFLDDANSRVSCYERPKRYHVDRDYGLGSCVSPSDSGPFRYAQLASSTKIARQSRTAAGGIRSRQLWVR